MAIPRRMAAPPPRAAVADATHAHALRRPGREAAFTARAPPRPSARAAGTDGSRALSTAQVTVLVELAGFRESVRRPSLAFGAARYARSASILNAGCAPNRSKRGLGRSGLDGISVLPSRAMLVLASRSPRRVDLLRLMGLRFAVRPAAIPEDAGRGEAPAALAVRLAREKAHAVALQLSPRHRGRSWVIGADTVVACGGRILGKPRGAREARDMLSMLSGRTHVVVTGVAVWRGSDGRLFTGRSMTRVTFREIECREIRDYVATGEPMDVAGAYAIQGRGGVFIPRISGSWSNVVGLPLDLVERLLERSGFEG